MSAKDAAANVAPELASPTIRVATVTVDPDRYLAAFLWLLAVHSDTQDSIDQDAEAAQAA
jgi:hypothetical protein